MGNWKHFLKNDLVPNIDVHRDTREIPDMSTYNSARWAVGTQKFTAPKVDLGGSLPRPTMQSPVAFHSKTDHISVAPPLSTQPFQREHDEALVRVKYNVNSQTMKNQWADMR